MLLANGTTVQKTPISVKKIKKNWAVVVIYCAVLIYHAVARLCLDHFLAKKSELKIIG